jgi:hypothetical protein
MDQFGVHLEMIRHADGSSPPHDDNLGDFLGDLGVLAVILSCPKKTVAHHPKRNTNYLNKI